MIDMTTGEIVLALVGSIIFASIFFVWADNDEFL